jgi:hypothetical protein
MSTFNPVLPFFSYGIFKPGALAYKRLQPFVDVSPVRALVRGSFWLWDGLPLLEPNGSGTVAGCLLKFQPGREIEAYQLIDSTEPPQHYRWATLTLSKPLQQANALLGRRPARASVPFEELEWSGRSDPVFTHGIQTVRQTAEELAAEPFISAPPDSFDWPRLFRLQMAYLLLWAAIERYAALAYGPNLEPMEKVRQIGADTLFQAALQSMVARTDEVFDSRDPDSRAILDVRRSESSAKYYYQVRSNMSHRGKGAWKDGELARQSLIELLAIFTAMLESSWEAKTAAY